MAAEAIPPFSGAREETLYVCGQTPPAHHVLRLNLRDLVGWLALIRCGRLAYPLLGDRAADRRPYRDPHHPGPVGAARAWLADDPLAREVVLVRGGFGLAAWGRAGQRGAERCVRGERPVAGSGWPLYHPHGVRGAPDRPSEWAAGRGAGLARLRPAWASGKPLAAGCHPDPRGARGDLACASLLHRRGRLAAVCHPGRRPGAVRVYVRGHMALQPHRRQRVDDP